MKLFAVFAAAALATGMIAATPAAAQRDGWDGPRYDRGWDDRRGWDGPRRHWDRGRHRGWRADYGWRDRGYYGRPRVVCHIERGYYGPERVCFRR